MKVLFVQGSPRSGGNTETICQTMAATLSKEGHEVETVRAADMNIGGCTECFACQGVEDKPGCPIVDDMDMVYDKVLASDVIVLATPVFCWGFTAQLKAVVDRFFAFCKFSSTEEGKFKNLIEGKKFACVVTAGGGPFDGAELCVANYRAMASFMHLANGGEFVAAPVGEPKTVAADKPLLESAEKFAIGLVQ